MSNIAALRAQRQSCLDKIAATREELTRCERAYESLSSFKTMVSQSQEDFSFVNQSKAAVLSQLESVGKNSLVVQRYQTGMQEATAKIGTGVIGAMYVFFLTSISSKLQEYAGEISAHEATIAANQREIAELDRQIEAARRAETARTAAKGGRKK